MMKQIIGALETLANSNNWFHTSDEKGGSYTAWRGEGEPDEIAEETLRLIISRADALKIARETLNQAEQERFAIDTLEAGIGDEE